MNVFRPLRDGWPVRVEGALHEAVVQRIDLVLAGLLVEQRLHLLELFGHPLGEIDRLREILVGVVSSHLSASKLPTEPVSTHGTPWKAVATQPS